MKPPAKVRNCTNHHDACDCREWQREQMEKALRIIYIWADYTATHPEYDNPYGVLEDIANLVDKTLRGK